jgi:hypothetical protein
MDNYGGLELAIGVRMFQRKYWAQWLFAMAAKRLPRGSWVQIIMLCGIYIKLKVMVRVP